MREDRLGLPITTASDAAARLYREGTELLLAAWPGALDRFDAALAEDAHFAAAHLARARALAMVARMEEARAALAAAEAQAPRATPREQGQVAILAAMLAGQGAKATAMVEAHLDAHPRDALVLAFALGAFGLYAFSGRADHDAARVALCERHAAHYAGDWWFEGYLGWSCTEAGQLDRGLHHTEAALALRPMNANAAHALAHARFERREDEAALTFLRGFLPHYPRDGILHAHISWHQALTHLERGETAEALALYEARIRPEVSLAPPLNTMTDSVSLLWRAALRPGAPALPWAEATAYSAARFAQPGLPFADVHAAMAEAVAGQQGRLEARIATLEALLAAGRLAAGPVVPALCRGIAAYARGEWDAAADHLLAALPETVRIGGSGAQRDMLEETAIAALIKAGREEEAKRLARRRAH